MTAAVQERVDWFMYPPATFDEIRRWQEQLDVLVGRERNKAYLLLYWEPGESWHPIERYMIGNAIPRALQAQEYEFYKSLGGEQEASESTFAELEGPSPREGCYYDTKLQKLVRPEGKLLPGITQRQWLLWREHSAFVTPLWVIQGSKGGHMVRFNPYEEHLRRLKRQPLHPPAPGELPFAPFDSRVLEALRMARKLHDLQSGLRQDFLERLTRPETHNAAERAFVKEYDTWFDDRVENQRTRPNTSAERVR